MLFRLTMRDPDFVIGPLENPYLKRWWLLPRNRFANVYLHQVLRSDDDRALHDHPWWNVSVLLRGGYWEWKPCKALMGGGLLALWRGPGSMVFRGARAAHRLEIDSKVGPAWTLFITGPKVRDWGFLCPKGWKPWQEFTAPGRKGEIGPGCGD